MMMTITMEALSVAATRKKSRRQEKSTRKLMRKLTALTDTEPVLCVLSKFVAWVSQLSIGEDVVEARR